MLQLTTLPSFSYSILNSLVNYYYILAHTLIGHNISYLIYPEATFMELAVIQVVGRDIRPQQNQSTKKLFNLIESSSTQINGLYIISFEHFEKVC